MRRPTQSTESKLCVALVGLLATGCTLITDAGERKVGRRVGLDLDYTFAQMDAHQSQPLDVVLVEQLEVPLSGRQFALRAHARIVLPPLASPYPDEHLVLRGVMTDRAEQLFFYADSNDDGQIQHGIESDPNGTGEHIWREELVASGRGAFVHARNFREFDPDEYVGGDGAIVLEVDPARATPWAPACASGRVRTLEVELTLSPDGERREIAYYKNYGSNPPPSKSIRLEDTVDGGSLYQLDVLVDGTVVTSQQARAPVRGDFVIAFAQWYPAALGIPLPCD